MNHIAGVEIAKALRDIGELETSISVRELSHAGHVRARARLYRCFSWRISVGPHQPSNPKRAAVEGW